MTESGGTIKAGETLTLARGAGTSLLGMLIGRLLQAFFQILLARLLGPAVFGLYATGLNLFRVLGGFLPLGLGLGVVRFGSSGMRPSPERLQPVLLGSILAAMGSACVFGALFFVGADWLANSLFGKPELVPVIRWFSVALPLAAGLRVSTAAIRISLRMEYVVISEALGQPLVAVVVFFALGLAGFGLWEALLATVVSFGVALATALFFLERLFAHPWQLDSETPRRIGRILQFSVPAALALAFSSSAAFVDRLMVAVLLPEREVGIYQAVAQSAILFTMIPAALGSILAPMVAALHAAGEQGKMEEMLRVSTKWSFYCGLPLFLAIASGPKDVLVVIFGPEYEEGAAALVVLATAHLINVLRSNLGAVAVFWGLERKWLAFSAATLSVAIVLNWAFIERWGLFGAGLASIVTFSILAIGSLWILWSQAKIWPYDRRFVKPVVIGIIAGVAVTAFGGLESLDPAARVAIRLVAIGAVFCIGFFAFGIDAEDRHVIEALRRRLVAATTGARGR